MIYSNHYVHLTKYKPYESICLPLFRCRLLCERANLTPSHYCAHGGERDGF